ncbi:class I SAM-dependent methyltransferase [Terracoccus sp. 273MFTsu3.1]|uniref:class I SAM-dependent methyltransferase n=1 Tax=Terracoccus sp. 273MFTsu3.1 TaxID=1172188 RepID=UPI000373DD70|nr:class I SAM-dependent methyltransferase [Terracoccus sp. 273MFTsu3.1]
MDPSERRAGVAALFDHLAPGYDRSGVPWFGPIGARLVELTAPRPGDRALDVGAGRGAATFPLVDAVGPTGHVTAVDLSPAMLEHLRAEAEGRGARVEAVVGEASPDTLPADTFDVVTASLVLFFDPQPAETLAGWVRLLRAGGRIGLSTFGPTDAAWAAAEAALMAYPPQVLDARTTGRSGPFATTDATAALLEAAGATEVDSHDEPLEVILPDAEAWRAWTMTLGLRQLWAAVPDRELPAVLTRIESALEPDRGDDGRLHLTQQVRYTTAARP